MNETAQYTGPIGLVIIVLLGVATALLIASMNKRIKRLPPSFPDTSDGAEQDPPPDDREP